MIVWVATYLGQCVSVHKTLEGAVKFYTKQTIIGYEIEFTNYEAIKLNFLDSDNELEKTITLEKWCVL